MILKSPTRLYLPSESDEVRNFLTYKDRQVQFQVQRLKQNFRWKASDPESYLEHVNNLKGEIDQCLLFHDENGQPYTYSGLWPDLQKRFHWKLENHITYPEPKHLIPWDKMPHPMRYYQENAVKRLLEAKHGGIEYSTGVGKSLILLNLFKENPVQTVIMAPLASIADQLYLDFIKYFGKKYVGKYGDGKKELGKLVTVCVAQSLTRVEKGTPAHEFFSKTEAILVDESHTVPSETFQAVCLDLVKDAPYRFFVSATQLRTDGAELVLKGITGPIVIRKEFTEFVDEGFLARPKFKIFNVPATHGAGKRDAKEETRAQLYRNPNVNELAAKIAAQMVNKLGRPTVILIEEFKQFELLKNYMTIPFSFAHGGASKDAKEYIAKEYWDSDNKQIIDDFNAGKIKCIIGTTAISTGVDLQPVGCVIYLQGGTSEIKIKQGIGRGTRKPAGKEDFYVIDFNVDGSPTMARHLNERAAIYETMGQLEFH